MARWYVAEQKNNGVRLTYWAHRGARPFHCGEVQGDTALQQAHDWVLSRADAYDLLIWPDGSTLPLLPSGNAEA